MHHPDDLIRIFNACFQESHQTQLAYGEDEPIYMPAHSKQAYHVIYFAHGFFSSALHECAHWLLAGPERRTQIDYGYWYAPDGRTAEQQMLFQQVEVKPQALEWLLADACGHPFRLSFDNLNGSVPAYEEFANAVEQQRQTYENQGVSLRAEKFRHALLSHYQRLKMSQPA